MTLSHSDLLEIMSALVAPVESAGKAVMKIHAGGIAAREKPDGSPVTDADEAAEAILLDALVNVAPAIPVVSEENAASHAMAPPDMFFLVDPIDGTREFLRPDSKGAFTVNIGLVRDGAPLMGIVLAPARGRLFTGIVGFGAQEMSGGQRRAITVRTVPPTGPVAIASRSHRDSQTDAWLKRHAISQTLSTGSSLKFCLLAAGEADVYPRFGPTMEWDTAAGDAVLRAAGGRMEYPEGGVFTYGKPAYRNGAFVAYGGYRI